MVPSSKPDALGGTSPKWTCLPPGTTTNYQFVSPVPDPQTWAVDALSLSWEELDPYAFPPAAILGKVVEKLQDYPCNRIILITPGWPNMPCGHVQPDPTVPAQNAQYGNSTIQPDPAQESCQT